MSVWRSKEWSTRYMKTMRKVEIPLESQMDNDNIQAIGMYTDITVAETNTDPRDETPPDHGQKSENQSYRRP